MKLGKLLLGIGIALLAACGGDKETAKGPLKVGIILPMTGDTSTYGKESWNGIQLAEEDLKKEGVDWKLILRDETSKKSEAGNQAKLLIDSERVDVLIGSVASSNTMQIAVEARESGVPLITPASTNDRVTIDGGPYVSRICFKDSFQGPVLAEFALSKGWKKAVAVVDKAQAYSVGLAENFTKAMKAAGGTVDYVYYNAQDTDFASTVLNVAEFKPQVIFISGYYPQAGPMIKQGKDAWSGIPVIGGDGLDSPDFISLLGDTNAEIYCTTHFAADAPDPMVRSFAERYEKRFGKKPGAMAALGYDVMIVLHDAVKRCPDPHKP
ncbi:MAG TPA: ABC transporter substrate-binding protein, partial [Planctomycetota bacterium]|nr:ABC transporter substrate-binding protein [Planctomycetota bacterium]